MLSYIWYFLTGFFLTLHLYFQNRTQVDSLEFLGFKCATNLAETTDGEILNLQRIKYVNVSSYAFSKHLRAAHYFETCLPYFIG